MSSGRLNMIEIYDKWRILDANMSNLLVSTVTVDVDHLPSFTDMEMLFALLALCEGNPSVTGGFP